MKPRARCLLALRLGALEQRELAFRPRTPNLPSKASRHRCTEQLSMLEIYKWTHEFRPSRPSRTLSGSIIQNSLNSSPARLAGRRLPTAHFGAFERGA